MAFSSLGRLNYLVPILAVCLIGIVLALAVHPLPARGQWVEPPGEGWMHATVSHHQTSRQFGRNGNVVAYDGDNARSVTTSLHLTAAVGLAKGIDAWAEVAAHRLEFSETASTFESTGVGDVRLFARCSPELVGIRLPVPVALRGGVKLPASTVEDRSDTLPLSDGQRDWELMLETGHSFYPRPLYMMGWAGYRWREENESIRRKPGDEWFAYVAAGGNIGDFVWKLAADGFRGQPPVRTTFDLRLVNDRRSYVQLLPTIGWDLGPGVAELGLRAPVAGQNMPAGVAVTVGFFLKWNRSLWE